MESFMHFAFLIPVLLFAGDGQASPPKSTVLVVVGAQGTPEYGAQFQQWAERWQEAAVNGKAEFITIGMTQEVDESSPSRWSDVSQNETRIPSTEADCDRDRLLKILIEQAQVKDRPLWLILLGHGTFDGKIARFNLVGPDISQMELAESLGKFDRPLCIINCASCSGPFLTELSGPNRVVVSATKSGHEYNFARFGDYLSSAITEPQADLDKDDETSILEAYLHACARVNEFYAGAGRLVTEHALLDDNGDRLGTPSDWFQGVRATKTAVNGADVDGRKAHRWSLVPSLLESRLSEKSRERRNQLEKLLEDLRKEKGLIPESEYLTRIEPILVELAEIYQSQPGSKESK